MHQYATDSYEKKFILLLIAILSIIATWFVYESIVILNSLTGLTPPWWLEIPSILTFYGVFYEIFDRWLWKKPVVHKLGLVRTPDLNGVWSGYVKSSHDEFKQEIEATLEVAQTWTHIEIHQKTKNSEGHSFAATIFTENIDAPRLVFMYRNAPAIDADPNMHQHLGSAQLVLSSDKKILSGDYYNCGRDRPTWGKLHFEKGSNIA